MANASIAAFSAVLLFLALFGCAGQQPQPEQNTRLVTELTKTNGQMEVLHAQNGNVVQVDYTGRLEEGAVFDTSIESVAREAGLPLRPQYSPLEFTVGAGQMIKGFDSAVVGMYEGQEKRVTIPPQDAYGFWKEENVALIPLANIDSASSLEVGQKLYTSSGMAGTVLAIEDGNAKVDFNHALADKTLVFDIKLVKIRKK